MYEIDDLEAFSDDLHREVVSTYGLDGRHVTTGQIVSFVREKFPEEDGKVLFDEGGLEEIINFAVGVLLGGCMSEMAADGELECAWDEEKNDMVWWLPEEE